MRPETRDRGALRDGPPRYDRWGRRDFLDSPLAGFQARIDRSRPTIRTAMFRAYPVVMAGCRPSYAVYYGTDGSYAGAILRLAGFYCADDAHVPAGTLTEAAGALVARSVARRTDGWSS